MANKVELYNGATLLGTDSAPTVTNGVWSYSIPYTAASGDDALVAKAFVDNVLVDESPVRNITINAAAAAGYIWDETTTKPMRAFSFRKINPNYVGFCCRVEKYKNAAWVEENIGFSGDYVDIAAIETFSEGTFDVSVAIYDQSGSGKIWDTTGVKPLIGATGALIYKNGKLVMNHSASTMRLTAAFSPDTPPAAATDFAVFASAITDKQVSIGNDLDNSKYYGIMGTATGATESSAGTPSYYKNSNIITPVSRENLNTAYQTGVLLQATIKGLNLSTWAQWNSRYNSDSLRALEFIGERLLYPAALSDTDIAAIEANQKSYYGTV